MEQGFDFSILRWIFIIGVVIIINFFNKKPKVTPSDTDLDGGEAGQLAGDEPTMKKFEELFGQIFEQPEKSSPTQQVVKEPQPRAVVQVRTAPTTQSKLTVAHQLKDDLSHSEIGSSESEAERIGANFDLREAVIMSEILTRKYEE